MLPMLSVPRTIEVGVPCCVAAFVVAALASEGQFRSNAGFLDALTTNVCVTSPALGNCA